jgi:putative membrane protein
MVVHSCFITAAGTRQKSPGIGHKLPAHHIEVLQAEKRKGRIIMKTKQFLNLTAAAALLTGSITIGSTTAQAADGPSDPQIVGIVLAADQIDIDYGKIALAKSKNKATREFAQRMVTDHSAVQQSVIGLAAKLGVTGEDSQTSTGLKGGAVDITAKLNALKGKEFDKFYIDNEVAYHKAVTDAVAGVLIPNAQNAELKSALEGAQPLFLKHLEHARMVQAGGEGKMIHN